MNKQKILLGHGSGGRLSHELIQNVFLKYFDNPLLNLQGDSTPLNIENKKICFTTDSYVVNPLFFPGGNIGKLAVCGTVNDLAVSGAKPQYLSCSFIIEEGFSLEELKTVVKTMKEEADKAGVLIVTGDTKVVDRGKCDRLFINTAGIGVLCEENEHLISGNSIQAGDKIIINGTVGDHGMTIMAARNFETFQSDISSDCSCLNHLIRKILKNPGKIKFMRDATRGGIATVLTELVNAKNFGIEIYEENIPVNEKVAGMCDMLGFDPLHVANEGKIIVVVAPDEADNVLKVMQSDEFGQESVIIGEIVKNHPGKGWIITEIGGTRMLDMLSGEQLPRIC